MYYMDNGGTTMKLVFKENPSIQIIAPKITTVKVGNYGWYRVEDCQNSGYENILSPFSMAYWELEE